MSCTAIRHDDVNAYSNYGCRCPEARRLKVRDWNMYVLRKMRGQQLLIPSTGTIRRIQALHAIGWRHADIGARLGVSGAAVSQILTRDVVHIRTAHAIAALYDELADHRGPSALTRSRAIARGWLQPLWWDDDTIDDPGFDPIRHYQDAESSSAALRTTEVQIVTELSAKGWSAKRIAEHLDCSARRVVRLRAAARPSSVSDNSGNVGDMQRAAS